MRLHLPELLIQIVAVDQDGPAGRPPLDEAGIARHDPPPFAPGEGHQVLVADRSEVGDVVPQKPQPAGQSPEHAVGREALRDTFDTPGSVC